MCCVVLTVYCYNVVSVTMAATTTTAAARERDRRPRHFEDSSMDVDPTITKRHKIIAGAKYKISSGINCCIDFRQ